MKKTIEVKLDSRIIIVKKLPLGKYAELLKSIQELPKHIPQLSGKTTDEILKELPFLISVALPDIISIFVIATDLKKEEAEDLGLDEAVKLALAIIEVNNYKEVFENLKKALARPVQKPGTMTGSIGQ
jgi:hypothetical protein